MMLTQGNLEIRMLLISLRERGKHSVLLEKPGGVGGKVFKKSFERNTERPLHHLFLMMPEAREASQNIKID